MEGNENEQLKILVSSAVRDELKSEIGWLNKPIVLAVIGPLVGALAGIAGALVTLQREDARIRRTERAAAVEANQALVGEFAGAANSCLVLLSNTKGFQMDLARDKARGSRVGKEILDQDDKRYDFARSQYVAADANLQSSVLKVRIRVPGAATSLNRFTQSWYDLEQFGLNIPSGSDSEVYAAYSKGFGALRKQAELMSKQINGVADDITAASLPSVD